MSRRGRVVRSLPARARYIVRRPGAAAARSRVRLVVGMRRHIRDSTTVHGRSRSQTCCRGSAGNWGHGDWWLNTFRVLPFKSCGFFLALLLEIEAVGPVLVDRAFGKDVCASTGCKALSVPMYYTAMSNLRHVLQAGDQWSRVLG